MVLKLKASGLLVLALSTATLVAAETAPDSATSPSPAASNQAATEPLADPASLDALKRMGTFLRGLKRFQVNSSIDSETVMEDGQKIQRGSSIELMAQRPNKLRANVSSARAERRLYYDGKQLSLYTPSKNFYGTLVAADSIDGLVNQLTTEYNMSLPLADLFLWGTDHAPIDQIESALYAGTDRVGMDICDQYVFRQGDLDWQIWIATGAKPLPRKLVITNRKDEARPQFSAVYTWNLAPKFGNSVFQFTPPKDAKPIPFSPADAIGRTN